MAFANQRYVPPTNVVGVPPVRDLGGTPDLSRGHRAHDMLHARPLPDPIAPTGDFLAPPRKRIRSAAPPRLI